MSTPSQSYPAALFDGARRTPGRVRVSSTHLSFENRTGEEVVEIPLTGLRAEVTGFDNGSFLLHHEALSGRNIVVDSCDLANDPALRDHPGFTAARARRASSLRRFRACSLVVAVAALLAFGSFAWLVWRIVRWFLG